MKQMVYGHLVHLVIRIADKCIRPVKPGSAAHRLPALKQSK